MIGAMSMPANFQYKDVFLKGYPRHEKYDSFRLKHPSMDYGRRAKIFSPFDALKGFNEAVAAKYDGNMFTDEERYSSAVPTAIQRMTPPSKNVEEDFRHAEQGPD